jgi:curved DNA-binding protein CbpA
MFFEFKTESEIKKLFRRFAKFLHPDQGGDAELMSLLMEYYKYSLQELHGKKSEIEKELFKQREEKERNQENKYKRVYEDVILGDDALKMVDEMKAYAKLCSNFKSDFFSSVMDFLDEKGYVTYRQYNSLLKVYLAFKMWEKKEEEKTNDTEK